jgi:hypothetical protein
MRSYDRFNFLKISAVLLATIVSLPLIAQNGNLKVSARPPRAYVLVDRQARGKLIMSSNLVLVTIVSKSLTTATRRRVRTYRLNPAKQRRSMSRSNRLWRMCPAPGAASQSKARSVTPCF